MDSAFREEPSSVLSVQENGPKRRSLIAITKVEKRYASGTVALADVNLQIGSGEFVSLLGPSGCGKSTLLRIIAGLSTPSSGDIHWPSAAYDKAGNPERNLGYVFQEPTLMPWGTVFDNVYLPLRVAGVSRKNAEPRISETLASVGLGAFAKAYPRELSGGMKMRVSIARALVVRPKLLLMDEPFAALDEITRTRLNEDLLNLFAAQDLTVIFVTHSVFESVYLSTRIVVMSARPGRISADLAMDAAYPRGEEFRMSPVYAEYCRTASAELRVAMAGTEEAH